ncbi:MAG TPA: hypothetical protein PLL20_07075 [Phycisphaerae bacterium]|nr:hypothetical protein [Phycisphaerae bacterium]HRR83473.1 hypothetical protein [Phycisphaerae bacterium]
MCNIAPVILMIVLPMIGLFFWVRGLMRASIGDAVAGLAILLLISTGILIVLRDSGGFDIVGCILIVFGVGTVATRPFATEKPPFKRRDLIPAGILFVIFGILGLIAV